MIWLIFPCLMLVGWLLVRRAEADEWNNGVCKKSGRRWVEFDTDSSGLTGYSDGVGNVMWK